MSNGLTKLSSEEYQAQTRLATQQALIDVGKYLGEKKQKETETELKKNNLFQQIINIIENKNTLAKKYSKSVYISNVENICNLLEFIYTKYQEDNSKLSKYNNVLYKDIQDMKYEIKNSNYELEELQSKYDNREEYWKLRVIKLREKCINRNITIKQFKFLLLAIVVLYLLHTCCLYIYGPDVCLNFIINICVTSVYCITSECTKLFKSFYYISYFLVYIIYQIFILLYVIINMFFQLGIVCIRALSKNYQEL